MRKVVWLLASLVLTAVSAVRAETLLEVYRLAVQNDPRLAAARFDHEASEQTVIQARAGLLPSVIFEAEKTTERQNILSSQNAVFGRGFSEFPVDQHSFTISQPIFRKAAWERLSQAQAAVKQAFAQRTAEEQNLILRVATAYLTVLAARDSLSFARAEKDSVGKQLQQVEQRVTGGLATMSQLHDARARYAQTESREIDAQNTLQDAQQALQEITGKPVSMFQSLRREIPIGRPDPPSVEKWVEKALAQNLNLEARRQAAEVARLEIEKQRSAYFPTLNLVGTYNNRKTGGSLFGGGSHVETTDLSLKLNLPLFEGGATGALTEEAVRRHQRALQEAEQERRQVERQARAAYQAVIGGISQVQSLRQGLISQTSALETKSESYRAGLVTVLAVLDAQRDLFFVQRDYARARYDYLLNRLRLKLATAILSEDDLAEINRLLE